MSFEPPWNSSANAGVFGALSPASRNFRRPAVMRWTRRTSSPSSVGKRRRLPRRSAPPKRRPSRSRSGGSNVFSVAMCAGPAFATGKAETGSSSWRRHASISGSSGIHVHGSERAHRFHEEKDERDRRDCAAGEHRRLQAGDPGERAAEDVADRRDAPDDPAPGSVHPPEDPRRDEGLVEADARDVEEDDAECGQRPRDRSHSDRVVLWGERPEKERETRDRTSDNEQSAGAEAARCAPGDERTDEPADVPE